MALDGASACPHDEDVNTATVSNLIGLGILARGTSGTKRIDRTVFRDDDLGPRRRRYTRSVDHWVAGTLFEV